MLTYQARERVFAFQHPDGVHFPCDCDLRFYLQPAHPFGMARHGGRTAVRGAGATLMFDANTGRHSVESHEPLKPLSATIKMHDRRFHLVGSKLSVRGHFETLDELNTFATSIYFALPFFLGPDFAEPPYVERVEGEADGAHFRWELAQIQLIQRTTTQKQQESAVVKALQRLHVFADESHRRLHAALHYFHVASRLDACGTVPGEFLAETILNLSKCLECIFPPDGDGKTREAVRRGLSRLRFTSAEIEAVYVPVMALRNEVDVAHVDLGLLSVKQRSTIHDYCGNLLQSFSVLFDRLFEALEQGELVLMPSQPNAPSGRILEIVDRLQSARSNVA